MTDHPRHLLRSLEHHGNSRTPRAFRQLELSLPFRRRHDCTCHSPRQHERFFLCSRFTYRQPSIELTVLSPCGCRDLISLRLDHPSRTTLVQRGDPSVRQSRFGALLRTPQPSLWSRVFLRSLILSKRLRTEQRTVSPASVLPPIASQQQSLLVLRLPRSTPKTTL